MTKRKMDRTLQIFNNEKKFSKDYFIFLKKHGFPLESHSLFHYGKHDSFYEELGLSATFSNLFSVIKHLKLLKLLFSSKRVVIHSLASPWLLLYLYLFPSLYKKTFWIVWGKDLYFYQLLEKKHFYHEIYEFFRIRVFKNIQHISALEGDYQLANKWYNVNAKCYHCFMYPSNLYKDLELPELKHDIISIQVGNSSDPSNNHLDIFKMMTPYKNHNIRVVVPLAYGDSSHAKLVLKEGKRIFGEKFYPLTEMLPLESYLDLLSRIDIAIFNHKRTQAMSNIITLTGLGKKVYIRSDISSWPVFEDQGIKLYDTTKGIDINPIPEIIKEKNITRTKAYFSEENYLKDLTNLLEAPI